MGCDLDDDVNTVGGHRVDRLREADGLTDVAAKVLGVDLAVIDERTGHRRIGAGSRRRRWDVSEGGDELVLERVHLCGVKGVGDRQLAPRDAALLQQILRPLHRLDRAGENDTAGAVDSCQRHLGSELADPRHGLGSRDAHRGHPPMTGCRLHDPPAMPDDAHRIVVSESTPATCSAASSPTLCPATASGRTPHDSHNTARAT